MSAYPVPFDQAGFPKISDLVPPKKNDASLKQTAQVTTESRSALRIPGTAAAIVKALWIQKVGGEQKSQSFQNVESAKNAAVDPSNHFHFLPTIDTVEIRWEVSHIDKVDTARFEIWSAADDTKAIWTREYSGAEAIKLLKGTDGKGAGPLDWKEIVVDGDADRFPDKCPNVAYAPYQLRLTVTCKETGAVTTAWTYFDILVHSIELHWGDQTLIPAGSIADVLPTYQTLTDRDEKALLADLRNTATKIDGTQNLELRLKSLNAAYVHLNEWYMWRDMAFLRFKGRWGAGPRIPVIAKIFLKSLEDPNGVHSTQAAQALGPAEFLWDWRDQTETDRTNEMAAFDARASAFVIAALKYKENAAGEPPACLNCHADRGGKRGGTQRVLPEFSSPAAFPFEVTKGATRTWGVISKALVSGPNACCTGVVFQPSRLALDSYQLRVFLATGAYKTTVDAAGTMDALVTAHPGLPTANTGMMVMFRQVDARYVRKGTNTPRADLDAVASEYAKGGIRVIWSEPNWTQPQFTQLMNDALAPDNAGEDVAYVRSRIYRTNARARRAGLTNWNDPVKTQIPHYNQWFGCPTGQTKPAESAALFTVPGRAIVEAHYIEPVVADYIERTAAGSKRKINDKKRKWNTFKAQNPTVSDPELRVRFYHQVLSQAQRDKINPEIRRRYEADRWQGWDIPRDKPEEWAKENYHYRTRKLVYLSDEMHVRKVLADGFEGVTVFHYQHFFDALNPDGTVYARQCAIGGVAAISMISDLGLSGAFTVWDHPTNLQRQILARTLCVRSGVAAQGGDGHTGPQHSECTFKDGNSTIVHEFGHFLHLPHAGPTGGADEARMHDQNDAKCIMNYDPDALHLCGGCLLRLRGWSFFQSKGQLGYDSTAPANSGCAPPDPTVAGLPTLLNNFYTDFV